MTLQERLDKANQVSVSLYLRRQELEAQRQQVVIQSQQCDLELMRLDGDIRILTALVAEEEKASGQ